LLGKKGYVVVVIVVVVVAVYDLKLVRLPAILIIWLIFYLFV